MQKLTLAVLFLAACTATPKKEETLSTPLPPASPVCLEPKELVTVVKESCGIRATFTDAVDQTIPGVVICVLDPSGPAMLCMTPAEAAARGERAGTPGP